MARYRLRFQLQEIDLLPGDTVLGRSPDCHVTLEDPLVSRRHAKIRIDDDVAVVEDLGSRNGLRINGAVCKKPTELRDGDRLRIGTQDFVFHKHVPQPERLSSKNTGFLRYCAKCSFPYPEEVAACPNCGHHERLLEEPTLSGVVPENRASWALQLLLELLGRSLAIGRWEEAEQVLKRAAAALEERFASGAAIDPEQFDLLAADASRIAQALQAPRWAKWLMTTHATAGVVPRPDVVARLRTIPLATDDEKAGVQDAVEQLAKRVVHGDADSRARDGLKALQLWRKELGQRG